MSTDANIWTPAAERSAQAVPIDPAFRRDRAIALAALVAITALSWGYMAWEAYRMELTGVCECFGLNMSGPDSKAWSWVQVTALFLMWGEMMVAMMTPTAIPMILTFAMIQRKRRPAESPMRGTVLFWSGYVIVWIGFSVVAAVAQSALHATALLSPGMVSTSSALGGGLLIAAGAFQFTRWKNACLAHCRSPLSFLMSEWREGHWGALVMGLKHGAYCTGCCWFLMGLLFVAGVMNILWIAAITALVLLEKVSRHATVAHAVGVVLLAWGLWVLGSA